MQGFFTPVWGFILEEEMFDQDDVLKSVFYRGVSTATIGTPFILVVSRWISMAPAITIIGAWLQGVL